MIALTEVHREQDSPHSIGSATYPTPVYDDPNYKSAKKLLGKVALIIDGETGIGRAVAIAYAKEGALLAIVYQDNEQDAQETKRCAEHYHSEVILLKGDISNPSFAHRCVLDTIEYFGQLDILVNNTCEQHAQGNVATVSYESLRYMSEGAAIINTSAVTILPPHLNAANYADFKDPVTIFTRSLSSNVVPRGIRVNAVAPGAVWTPAVIASRDANEIMEFGKNTPMKRAAHPFELAPAYVYLACNDSSYMSGQILYINGGQLITS